MTRIASIPCLLFVLVALTGCTGGPPDSQSIEKAMNELSYSQQWDGLFEITNMRKTNSWKKGDDTIVEFSYERKALYDMDEAIRYLQTEAKRQDPTTLEEKLAVGLLTSSGSFGTAFLRMAMEQQLGYFEKGQVSQYTYNIAFYETENGWRYSL